MLFFEISNLNYAYDNEIILKNINLSYDNKDFLSKVFSKRQYKII